MTLEQALGLATLPGGAPWWRLERMAERDELLRRLAAPLAGRTAARAHALALTLRRYASVGWRHDRSNGRPLGQSAERALLFRLFTVASDPPTSVRRLIDILAG